MNKEIDKEKMCKVGLKLGRNDFKIEGNVQMGCSSRTEKKYKPVDEVEGGHSTLTPIKEEQEEDG